MINNVSTSQILRVAAQATGGLQALAKRLGATEAQVQAWIDGRAVPPFGIALRAAEIASEPRLALGLDAEPAQGLGAAAARRLVHRRVEARAAAVHRHEQRTEAADPELP